MGFVIDTNPDSPTIRPMFIELRRMIMEKATDRLLNQFYQDYWLSIAFMIVVVAITVMLIVLRIAYPRKSPPLAKKGLSFLIFLLISASFLLGFFLIKNEKNYIYLKSNSPLVIEGTVIGFANTSESEGTITRSYPIVRVNETGEEIPMGVLHGENKVKIGETYAFVYLPNTGMAEVYESIPLQGE